MTTSPRRVTSVVAVCSIALFACGSSGDRSAPSDTSAADTTSEVEVGPMVVTDDLGEVTVDAPATVIVGTSDEATEMLVSLGIEPAGIASARVDPAATAGERFADYFLTSEQVGDAEFVGTDVLNFEAIAALQPDLIVHASDDENVDTLRGIAPTVVFDIQVPGRWQTAITELGRAADATELAADSVASYDTAVAAARDDLADLVAERPSVTVIYPNYRAGDDNFVFDADFALAAVVPELGFDLVGIEAAEPAFPGVGTISTERYGDLAAVADTIIALNPNPWQETPSGPFLDSLDVPVLGVLVDEGRPSTGPLSAPVYLERFVDAITSLA